MSCGIQHGTLEQKGTVWKSCERHQDWSRQLYYCTVNVILQQGHVAARGEHGEGGWMVPLTLWALSITFFFKKKKV